MLFSATITKGVMKLISISLQNPIYISVNKQNSVVDSLVQEFIRIRPSREVIFYFYFYFILFILFYLFYFIYFILN